MLVVYGSAKFCEIFRFQICSLPDTDIARIRLLRLLPQYMLKI